MFVFFRKEINQMGIKWFCPENKRINVAEWNRENLGREKNRKENLVVVKQSIQQTTINVIKIPCFIFSQLETSVAPTCRLFSEKKRINRKDKNAHRGMTSWVVSHSPIRFLKIANKHCPLETFFFFFSTTPSHMAHKYPSMWDNICKHHFHCQLQGETSQLIFVFLIARERKKM